MRSGGGREREREREERRAMEIDVGREKRGRIAGTVDERERYVVVYIVCLYGSVREWGRVQ